MENLFGIVVAYRNQDVQIDPLFELVKEKQYGLILPNGNKVLEYEDQSGKVPGEILLGRENNHFIVSIKGGTAAECLPLWVGRKVQLFSH